MEIDTNRVARIGIDLASEIEKEYPEVRVFFQVSKTADESEVWLTTFVSSRSSKRSQEYTFFPPRTFYDDEDTEIIRILQEQINRNVYHFLKKLRS